MFKLINLYIVIAAAAVVIMIIIDVREWENEYCQPTLSMLFNYYNMNIMNYYQHSS